MPLDWFAIAAVLLLASLALFVAGRFGGPVWRARARTGCGALGMLAASIVSMVLLALSLMAQGHQPPENRTPFWYPFVLAAVPLLIGAGVLALTVPPGRRIAAIGAAGRWAAIGCGGLMIFGLIGILLLAGRSAPQ